jgi:sirohydrochlorin ferrochelatase
MRNAIVTVADQRTTNEWRQVMRAAIRQLDRADIYLAAVSYMDLGDPAFQHALTRLRADLAGLERHLSETRAEIRP